MFALIERGARVGGLAQTHSWNGCLVDAGGHRFFTEDPGSAELWRALSQASGIPLFRKEPQAALLLGDSLIDYPLRAGNLLRRLGPARGLAAAASYARAVFVRNSQEGTLDDWVRSRYGGYISDLIFVPHTQKVFGRSPRELTGAWAAERIKDPTPSQALRRLSRTGGLRGMPQSFLYPRKGPGELWDGVAALCGAKGARILVDTTATAIGSDSEGFAVTTRSTDGRDGILRGRSIVATCPLAELARMLNVDRVVAAQLTQMPYRHLMTLVILFDRVCHLEQQLIYVTAPESRFRRFQVYDKWSEELVPPGKSCFGFELTYDDHSSIPDGARLVDEATEVLRTVIGRDLGPPDAYCQLRFPHAYVRLDPASIAAAREVRAAFTDQFPRLYLAGRHGEFEYMNQDAAFKSGASVARAATSAG